jgi:hypothetical protein
MILSIMEEIEVPLEKIQQDIEHAVEHAAHANWVSWSALLSAIFAVMAAVAALKAGQLANEAMIDQIRASDQWAYYQAKGIKGNLAEAKHELLSAMGKSVPADSAEKAAKYREEQREIKESAEEKEHASAHAFERHEIFSQCVTFFQVAIALTAIAVLSRRKQLLYISGAMGIAGIFFLSRGFFFFH